MKISNVLLVIVTLIKVKKHLKETFTSSESKILLRINQTTRGLNSCSADRLHLRRKATILKSANTLAFMCVVQLNVLSP